MKKNFFDVNDIEKKYPEYTDGYRKKYLMVNKLC